MKRIVSVFLISAVSALIVAAPVVSGGEGLVRVVDARNQGLYAWTTGISFAGDEYGAEHLNDLDIKTWNNSVLRLFGSWVPFEPLEVIAAAGLGYSYLIDMPGTGPSVGPWDLELGAKYTWPLEFWTVGADGRIFLPTRSSLFGGPRFGGSFKLLASTDINILAAHLNLGVRLLDDPSVVLGAGVETRYEFLNPYLELTAGFSEDEAPIRLTPGIRILTNTGFSIFGAADFGLNRDGRSIDADGDYYVNQFSAGVAYSPSGEKVVKRRAMLSVTVTDAVSEAPVSAQVNIAEHYPGTFMIGPSGQRVIDVQSGWYQVTVSAPGYAMKTYRLHFSPHGINKLKVVLEPDRTGASLTVRVTDRQTGMAINGALVTVASITLNANSSGEVTYSIPPGTYTIDVTASGYLPESEQATIVTGIPLALNITLLKNNASVRISGIHFASGSAQIPPESYPVIDDAIRVLKGNPNIRIEVQGHTDSQGSAQENLVLSQLRAEAVREYLVSAHGIPPSRLEARGYGEENPIASNATEAGRAQNRRVELVVMP